MPELSVILPVRDAAGTVAQAVTSTLRALPADSELVVLDDGSTDGTADVLGSLSDRRLRVKTSTGSGGIAAALNCLLDATDSRYVARMDADDIGLPWRFATAMPAVEQDADVVFSPVVELRGRRLVPGTPMPITPEALGLHLLLTNPVSHPTMVARRAALEAVGGYRNVPAEDYDLWLRLVSSGAQLLRVGTWGLLYRVHPAQITASSEWRARSWASEQLAEAFADASARRVGTRLTRLVAIPQLPPERRQAALGEFKRALRAAIGRVSGAQALFLRRRLNERLRWVEHRLEVGAIPRGASPPPATSIPPTTTHDEVCDE